MKGIILGKRDEERLTKYETKEGCNSKCSGKFSLFLSYILKASLTSNKAERITRFLHGAFLDLFCGGRIVFAGEKEG